MINTEIMLQKMREKNLTQEALSELIGVSQPMCSRILRGFKRPSLEVAKRMAEAFGCTVDELIQK